VQREFVSHTYADAVAYGKPDDKPDAIAYAKRNADADGDGKPDADGADRI
jgi:hypothetical protein